ncbi:MAG: polyphosphate polymerase domain-containing protein [Lachnospiraceae bacterium]|nr:polyphosphate polymerase domain-containing protein [Lachnospiraceae bacterium]
MKGNDIFERIETKYLMDGETCERFRKETADLIETDRYGDSKILNIYFDNDTYELVRRSMEKPVYKEKLRLRTYGIPTDDSPAFIEIKKKYDGIVYKRRVELPYREAFDYLTTGWKKNFRPESIQNSQICREIDYFLKLYRPEPKFFIGYDRIATYSREDPDLRLTFDRNLRFRQLGCDLRRGDKGILYDGGKNVLLEIKAAGAYPLWLSSILDELKIYPVSFSKYGSIYRQTYQNIPPASYMNVCNTGCRCEIPYEMPAQPVAI